MLRLYSYWRSSSAYRVRIALNLKGLDCEIIAVHLLRDGGEQLRPAHLARNPQALVPVLEHGDRRLIQSLAIIEYLEDMAPAPALLPDTPGGRARVRGLAQLIAAEMQPLNNLRVLRYLKHELGADDSARDAWYRHWLETGFAALEQLLRADGATGRFCHGDTPGLADACLVPQVYNAERYHCDLQAFPVIRRIAATCRELDAFARAAPEQQPDAE